MKKAFIGKGFRNEYICFTRYKMRGNGGAEVHSEANKYDVSHYVNCAIVNWIGERIAKAKKENKDFGEVVGNDFNKLANKLRLEEKKLIDKTPPQKERKR